MLTEFVVAALLQSDAPQRIRPRENEIAAPNSVFEVWPDRTDSVWRWMGSSPADKRPFLVAQRDPDSLAPTRPELPIQIAVRAVWNRDDAGSPGVYFVAMRQTVERLEEADSRDCPFAPVMARFRAMDMPEPIVPGTLPPQPLAFPPGGHGGVTVALTEARQTDGHHANLLVSASHGELVSWVHDLFEATRDCWKPMVPPATLGASGAPSN